MGTVFGRARSTGHSRFCRLMRHHHLSQSHAAQYAPPAFCRRDGRLRDKKRWEARRSPLKAYLFSLSSLSTGTPIVTADAPPSIAPRTDLLPPRAVIPPGGDTRLSAPSPREPGGSGSAS